MVPPTSCPPEVPESDGATYVSGILGGMAVRETKAQPATGRPLEESGLKVQVYRNLHKGLWSVRSKGRVITHRPLIILRNCTMRVQESERQRVIREGQRNVHAWIVGEPCWGTDGEDMVEIGYNPFYAPTFTSRPSFEPVTTARYVIFSQEGKAYAIL